jgi:hypothetical protein
MASAASDLRQLNVTAPLAISAPNRKLFGGCARRQI